MREKLAATESRAAWLSRPELREAMARVENGEATPEDVRRLADAAPPEQRSLVPFMATCARAAHLLNEARDRAVDQAEALMQRVLSTNDPRSAVEAIRFINDRGLLDDPEPRFVGSELEPGWALDLESDEAILAQAVVPRPSRPSVAVALVAPEKVVPPPAFDEEAEERIAEAVADAFCRAEGVR